MNRSTTQRAYMGAGRRFATFLLALAMLAGLLPGGLLRPQGAAAADTLFDDVIDISTMVPNSYVAEQGKTYRVTGSMTGSSTSMGVGARYIAVPNGVTATFYFDNVYHSQSSVPMAFLRLESGATATVVLMEGTQNTIDMTSSTSNTYLNPAIYVPAGATLKIQGTGTLNAKGHATSAGIGGSGGGDVNAGTVIIEGGTVIATGGENGAGIGGGNGGAGGTVIISGGTVTATGGARGAGIGGGNGGAGGTVTISGGTVVASAGTNGGAGIGGGGQSVSNRNGTTGGAVTITGGTVTATGGTAGQGGAGIGGGGNNSTNASYRGGAGGTVTIEGGTVTAVGGGNAAGIGGGGGGGNSGLNGGAGGTVTITGGTIVAKSTASGTHSAGIGGGRGNSTSGTNIITSGSVEARSGNTPTSPLVIYPSTGTTDGTNQVYCVTVTVTDTGGDPVAGARVTIGSYTADTNSEGRAYCWLPLGSYLFAAEHPEHGSGFSDGTVMLASNNAVSITVNTRLTLSRAPASRTYKGSSADARPTTLTIDAANGDTGSDITTVEWFRVPTTTVITEADFDSYYSLADPADKSIIHEPETVNEKAYNIPVGKNGIYWVRVTWGGTSTVTRVDSLMIQNIYDQISIGTRGYIDAEDRYLYGGANSYEPIPGQYGIPYDMDGTTVLGNPIFGHSQVTFTRPAQYARYWDAELGGNSLPYTVTLDADFLSNGDCDSGDYRDYTIQYTRNPSNWKEIDVSYVDGDGESVNIGGETGTKLWVPVDANGACTEFLSAGGVFAPKSAGLLSPVGYYIAAAAEATPPYIPQNDFSVFDPKLSAGELSAGETLFVLYDDGQVSVKERYMVEGGHEWVSSTSIVDATSKEYRKNSRVIPGFVAVKAVLNWKHQGEAQSPETFTFDFATSGLNPTDSQEGQLQVVKNWSSLANFSLDVSDVEVIFYYVPAIDGIPLSEAVQVDVYWTGVYADNTSEDLHHEQFFTRRGKEITVKYDENGPGDVIPAAAPAQWVFDDTRPDAGGENESRTFAPAEDADIIFFYNYDTRGAGVADKAQKVVVNYRLYGNDSTPLFSRTERQSFMGDPYTRTAPEHGGYVAVGWVKGDYNAAMSDTDIHHVARGGDPVQAGFTRSTLDAEEHITFIYRAAAAPATVHWEGTTRGLGLTVPLGSMELTGYVGEELTVYADDMGIDAGWRLENVENFFLITLDAAAQTETFHYTEINNISRITIVYASTDDNFHFQQELTRTNTEDPFLYTPWAIPGYAVREVAIDGEYTDNLDYPTFDPNGTFTINPQSGDQIVTVTYESTAAVITISAEDGQGEVLQTVTITDVALGSQYPVYAPQVPNYVLSSGQALMQLVTVQSGVNKKVFVYERLGDYTVECYEAVEGGADRLLLTRNAASGVAVSPPDLSAGYYTFDEHSALNSTNLTPDDENKTIKLYYTKDRMDVHITAVQDADGTPLGEETLVSDARKGELYTAVAPDIPWHTPVGQRTRAVYADPNAGGTLEVAFRYSADLVGEVAVVAYYMDGGTRVELNAFTGRGVVGSKFTAVAGTFDGFTLSGAAEVEVVVSDTGNLIEFLYTDVRATVTVAVSKDGVADGTLTAAHKTPAGTGNYKVYPPHLSGFVLMSYTVGGQTYNSNLTEIDIGTVNADTVVTLNYVNLHEVASDMHATATLISYEDRNGNGQYDVGEEIDVYFESGLIAGASYTVSEPDLSAAGYQLASAAVQSRELIHGENVFYIPYVKTAGQWVTLSVRAVYSGGAEIDGIYYQRPADRLVQKGSTVTVSAPVVAWHALNDIHEKVVTPTENREITFTYVPVQQNIEVRAVDGAGNILRVNHYSATVGAARTFTAATEFPALHGWVLNDAPTKELIAGAHTASNVVTFTYARNERDVQLMLVDENNVPISMTMPKMLGMGIGETIVVHAPHIPGYILDLSLSEVSRSVTVAAGEGAQQVKFHYKSAIHSADVTVIGMAGSTELYRYIITGDIATDLEVEPIPVAYYTAATAPQTVTFGTHEQVLFQYTSNFRTVTVTAVDEGQNPVPGFVPKSYEAVAGLEFTAYAPVISGWVVANGIRQVTQTIHDDTTIPFVYKRAEGMLLIRAVDGENKVIEVVDKTVTNGTHTIYASELGTITGWVPDDDASKSVTYPAVTTVDFLYKKDLATITVQGVEEGNENHVLFSDTQPVQVGTQFAAAMQVVPGYTLAAGEAVSKTIYVTGNATITFVYTETFSNVRIIHQTEGGAILLLEEDTAAALSSYTAYARQFAGYALVGPGAQTEPVPENHVLTITFTYAKDITEVTVMLLDSKDDALVDSYRVSLQLDVAQTLYAPALPGYVIDSADRATITPTGGGDDEVRFYYTALADIVSSSFVTVTVIGRHSGGELYRYTATPEKNSGPYEVLAFEVKGYALTGPASPATVNIHALDVTVTFEYITLANTVTIHMLDENSDPVAAPIQVAATTGQAFGYNAPYVEGYYLTSPSTIGTIDEVLPGSGNEITFRYARITSAVTIIAKEGDTEGRIIGVFAVENPTVDTADYEVPDLSGDFYAADAPKVSITYDGTNAVSVEAYYTKELVSVVIQAYSDTDTGMESPLAANPDTSAGHRRGEVAEISAPGVAGYALVGAATKLVIADNVTPAVFIFRTLASGEVLVTAVDHEGGTLQSYVIRSSVDAAITVEPPAIQGWTTEDLPRQMTVSANGAENAVTFVYSPIPEERTADVVVSYINHNTGAEIKAETIATLQVNTQFLFSAPAAFNHGGRKYTRHADTPATIAITVAEGGSTAEVFYTDAGAESTVIGGGTGGGGITAPDTDTDTDTEIDGETDADSGNEGVGGMLGEMLETRMHVKYLNGYVDGTMRPGQSITRAEAAAIFFRLLKEFAKHDTVRGSFGDVAADAWYAQSVNYLVSIGILTGYADGTFRPEQPVTRAEFVAIAARFDTLVEHPESQFADVDTDNWAVVYINSAFLKGWVSGYPDGTFGPENPITRAEAVRIINTMLGRRLHPEDVPAGVDTYSDLPESHWAYADMLEASHDHAYTRKADGYEFWK